MYDKEKIYDEKIFPLMGEIIDICKKSDIQMLFSCYLKTDEFGDMNCTTYLRSEEQNCDSLEDAFKVIRHGYVAQKPYIIATTIMSK
jgi:hypothetical protein